MIDDESLNRGGVVLQVVEGFRCSLDLVVAERELLHLTK